MSIVVLLTTKAKDGQFDTLVATMKAILPDTVAREGAELVRAAADPEEQAVFVYEVWDTVESQQAYIAWRSERGDLDKLASLLREPPTFEILQTVY